MWAGEWPEVVEQKTHIRVGGSLMFVCYAWDYLPGKDESFGMMSYILS